MSKQIDPQNWQSFLAEFSERNRGRRARFELFHHAGDVREEEQEAHFESASVDGRVVTIKRIDTSGRARKELTLDIHDTHGIAVQYDTDDSEDTLEFTNHNGDMTVLHFESKVDGDS
jgi:hypothetical protein